MSKHETAWEWFQSTRGVPPVAKLKADHQEIERLQAKLDKIAALYNNWFTYDDPFEELQAILEADDE